MKLCCLRNAEGNKSAPWIVANTVASRASGFPVMEKVNDYIYFAWTQMDSVASVQTAAFPVKQILSPKALLFGKSKRYLPYGSYMIKY